MQTRIEPWDNSLAVRIPPALAAELHVAPGTPVDVALVNGTLVVTPLPSPAVTLDALLQGITPENLHSAIDTGPALGREAW